MKDEATAAFDELFPFEYCGGGYFRKKGVAIGKSAELLHGTEAVRFIFDKLYVQSKADHCSQCGNICPDPCPHCDDHLIE